MAGEHMVVAQCNVKSVELRDCLTQLVVTEMTDVDFFFSVKFPKGVGGETGKDDINENGYLDLFQLPFFNEVYEFLTDKENEKPFGNLYSFVDTHAKLCDNESRQLQVIAAGVGVLNAFIQKNWTGPDIHLEDRLAQLSQLETRVNVLKELVIDGENVISVVELPELLFISKVILEVAWSSFKSSQAAKIWYLRCLFIHQQTLEELSPHLFEKISFIINEITNDLSKLPRNVAVSCRLEFARIFLYYENVQKSKIEVRKGTELSGIDVSLSGALGRRTKFQKEDLAQLTLKVIIQNDESLEDPQQHIFYTSQPKDVKLDDDVRLDKIKYADTSHVESPDLSGLQQGALLGNLFQNKKSQPKDDLADEELQPLINCILEHPKIWSIRMTTLLLRSRLEANHKRTVERSMMQMQVLSDCLKESEVSIEQRFSLFFLSYLPPKWEIQSTLANILTSMGSIKSALEIYLSLEKWEDVICCYNALQLRHKAQEVIERELEKDPSPKLWCLLGDAKDDVSCYEKAWELSKEKSARAQRHWAYFYYHRKKYGESIEHFQKSLEINSLQKEVWYRLGYAALMEEKWEVSAQAYRRYCVLDPECFEAWNNLARCYCELRQKQRAWKALQEALKVDRSNWMVWDNYMIVSSDLKAFDEVIKSYHEILNLKGKHLEVPVLTSLVGGYKSSADGGEITMATADRIKFRNKLLELFGRLTSQIINDGDLWFLYSEIVDADSPENVTKKYQLLLKAHRSAVNKPDWEKSLENCNRVIYILSKTVEVGLKTHKMDVLMSCKLAAAGALAKIKKTYPDAGVCEELEKNLKKVDDILNS